MIALFKESADIQTPDMLKLPVPEAEYENVTLKPSEAQKEMVQALADRVDDGSMAVAFSMFPTTMEDLMDIADAGAIMPPKSTWFEPKLRSGLFIHKLSE